MSCSITCHPEPFNHGRRNSGFPYHEATALESFMLLLLVQCIARERSYMVRMISSREIGRDEGGPEMMCAPGHNCPNEVVTAQIVNTLS